MKLCTMYKIVHGLADFSSPPISFRENMYNFRHTNPLTIAGLVLALLLFCILAECKIIRE